MIVLEQRFVLRMLSSFLQIFTEVYCFLSLVVVEALEKHFTGARIEFSRSSSVNNLLHLSSCLPHCRGLLNLSLQVNLYLSFLLSTLVEPIAVIVGQWWILVEKPVDGAEVLRT